MKYLQKNSDKILFVVGITLATLGIYWIVKSLKN